MAGLELLGLDHVTVTAPAELEAEVIDWYEKVLGLEQIRKPEGTGEKGAWFSLGGSQLHLSQDPHNPPRRAHFAIHVGDFNGAVEHLRGHGCHIEQAKEIRGRHRFFTRDPAGNRIEFFTLDEGGE